MGTATLDAQRVVAMLDGPCGAYVHVPFCQRICPFCPYNKVLPRGDQPLRYFEALGREVQAYRAAGAGPFTSLYVGGGTPTLFPDLLAEVVAGVPVTGEVAVEVLPTHATDARLHALAEMGVTAVSIGAQSFDDAVLRHLRRPHDAGQARAAVRAALARFALVDVDLIVDVALGGQAGTFLADLEECLRLGVDQVSTYPLMRFGYTPFGRARHDRRTEHAVLSEASRLAHAHGYERRSVWTFNRRGSPTYTSITRRRFLGLGAGASSFLGRDFLVNHFGVGHYVDALAEGRLPIARWLHLGPVGGMGYDLFWQAYAGGIDSRALADSYGPWALGVPALAAALAGVGLVSAPRGGCARLTPRGFDAYHDLERWVTYQLIEPLWAQMLSEHAQEAGAARWASPARARSGVGWRLVEALMERPQQGHPAPELPVA